MDSFEASNSARCAGALSRSKEIWGELIPGAMVYGPLAMARGYYFSLHNYMGAMEQCGRRLGPQVCLRQRANRRTAGPCVSKQGIGGGLLSCEASTAMSQRPRIICTTQRCVLRSRIGSWSKEDIGHVIVPSLNPQVLRVRGWVLGQPQRTTSCIFAANEQSTNVGAAYCTNMWRVLKPPGRESFFVTGRAGC